MTLLIVVSTALIIASVIGGKLEGKHDALNGTDPQHWKDWLKRAAVAVPFSIVTILFLFYPFQPLSDSWFYTPQAKSLIALWFLLQGMALFYGFFLDTTHNKYKGKEPDYVGSSAPNYDSLKYMAYGNTAASDKLAHKWGVSKWLVEGKFWGGVASSFIYFAWIINCFMNTTI